MIDSYFQALSRRCPKCGEFLNPYTCPECGYECDPGDDCDQRLDQACDDAMFEKDERPVFDA